MIEAAGGAVWKVTPKGVLKVLLVHRPAYDDWSLPKGKVEPGETDEHAATHADSVGFAAPVVDLDLLFANTCLGEPLFAERGLEREPAGDDVLRDYRIAGIDPKGVAELRRVGTRPLQPGELDRCEPILLARRRFEHDLQHVAGRLGARLNVGVIITLAAQQFLEQIGVSAGTASNLRGIGRLLAVGFERGLLAERLEEISSFTDNAETLDDDGVFAFTGVAVALAADSAVTIATPTLPVITSG